MSRLKLFDDFELELIVDDILGRDPAARAIARKRLWPQVELYVTRVAKLPLGPLREDEEARRDVYVAVMTTLEANNFARLGAWRARRLNGTDRSSFWGLVRVTAQHRSIDYARAHPRNIAGRGSPFCWVCEEVAPPLVLESLPSQPFLTHCTAEELYDYLDRFHAMHHASAEPAGVMSFGPRLPVPDLVLPEGSGKHRR